MFLAIDIDLKYTPNRVEKLNFNIFSLKSPENLKKVKKTDNFLYLCHSLAQDASIIAVNLDKYPLHLVHISLTSKNGGHMTKKLFNETINGASIEQIHEAALKNLIRVYNPIGSVFMSREDLDDIAWTATMTVFEKRDTYVKKDKNVCGLACKIAYNDLMHCLNKSMEKNKSTVPMEQIDTEKGYYNTADAETGRKFTLYGVGVGREFDTSFGEGMEIIEKEIDKFSEMDKRIYELNLDRVPHKEIASMCGITPANARKKWFDIRRRLLKNKYIFNRAHEMGLVG